MNLQNETEIHVKNILKKNYNVQKNQHVLLIYDEECELAKILSTAYKTVLTQHILEYNSECNFESILFYEYTEEKIRIILNNLPKNSLVILVQTNSFRMSTYRFRADLFREGHSVIEHARLGHNTPSEIATYISSLTYDMPRYVRVCNTIEDLLMKNKKITIVSTETKTEKKCILEIDSEYEKPTKNTGDFTNKKIIAAGFPIGEIFTEAKDLENINGSIIVFGFPRSDHKTFFCEPFTVNIKDGKLIGHTGPLEFTEIIELIKAEEGSVFIREIGFGLNTYLGINNKITEPTAFERFCGMHFSLGKKHTMYRHKFKRKDIQKFHIDIFCNVETVTIGKEIIFENGKCIL